MTKRNKELREIYLLAAGDIATKWDYCCNTIYRAAKRLQIKDEGNLAAELFQFLYRPHRYAVFFWLRGKLGPKVCQQNRILALLFMAELARTDSLPTLPLTPADLGLTQFQFDNLHKLLAYAKAHPDIPFDITSFVRIPSQGKQICWDVVNPSHECGTTCCLAGMGVFAGIDPLTPETWEDYIQRNFGFNTSSDEFKYLFSDDHLNSLPHAIARLEDFLTNGLPQDVELTTHEIL